MPLGCACNQRLQTCSIQPLQTVCQGYAFLRQKGHQGQPTVLIGQEDSAHSVGVQDALGPAAVAHQVHLALGAVLPIKGLGTSGVRGVEFLFPLPLEIDGIDQGQYCVRVQLRQGLLYVSAGVLLHPGINLAKGGGRGKIGGKYPGLVGVCTAAHKDVFRLGARIQPQTVGNGQLGTAVQRGVVGQQRGAIGVEGVPAARSGQQRFKLR